MTKDYKFEYEKLLRLANRVNLDHDCGLEGFDKECDECRLALHLWFTAKEGTKRNEH